MLRRFFIVFAAVAAMSPVAANAFQVSSPLGMAPLSVQDRFTQNPSDLLSRYPDAGFLLVKEVRELTLANTDLAKSIIAVAKSAAATPAQIESIGIGLGQAASAAAKVNFEAGQQIQLAILEGNLAPLTTAFLNTTGDVETAALSSSTSPSTGAALGGASAGAVGAIGDGNAGGKSASTASSSSTTPSVSPSSFTFALSPPSPPTTVPDPIPGNSLLQLVSASVFVGLLALVRSRRKRSEHSS